MKSRIAALMLMVSIFIYSTAFTVSSINDKTDPTGGAYLTFAGKFGGELTVKNVKETRRVEVSGCAKGSKIFKFTLNIVKKGKKLTHRTKSSNLTKAMLKDLKTLQKGDKFYFKSVEAYLPNGRDKVDVHSREFRVK